MELQFQDDLSKKSELNKMYIRNLGIHLSENQIENLVRNARNLRTENIILKEELAQLKEVSA